MVSDDSLTKAEKRRMLRLYQELETLRNIIEDRDYFLMHACANIARDAADLFDAIADRWEEEGDDV